MADTEDAMTAPVYFELSWAILSTIGLINMLFGVMVIGITSLTTITALPVIISAACALANGMCYYAFYANYPLNTTLVASAFADLAWLIQEVGLPFYSYILLTRVLRSRSRLVFLILFWFLILSATVLRCLILAVRIRSLNTPADTVSLQHYVNGLHIGFFITVALLEIVSAFFLLRKFSRARRLSLASQGGSGGLFRYLMRSTEIRMALLALIGTTRAITYSFQSSAQSAKGVAGQLDRFAYTLECLFPVLMFIDILASKLAFANDAYQASSSNKQATSRKFTQQGTANNEMYPLPDIERRVDIEGGTGKDEHPSPVLHRHSSSSQEHIAVAGEAPANFDDKSDGSSTSPADKAGVISKTIVFNMMYERQGKGQREGRREVVVDQ